jgi:DNA-binding PadR family transcriptional regulator
MPKANNSYYMILGILGSGSMSGYSIKSALNQGVGFFCDINYQQIYPTLKKMVDDGLATYHVEDNGSRPRSKVYTLTDKGHDELIDWLNKPIVYSKLNAKELRLKLFFGHYISVKKNIEHVQKFKESVIKDIDIMSKIKDRAEKEIVSDASCNYRIITVTNGVKMANATLDWCNETIDYLKKFDN